jgi:hypothetical protein
MHELFESIAHSREHGESSDNTNRTHLNHHCEICTTFSLALQRNNLQVAFFVLKITSLARYVHRMRKREKIIFIT